MSGREHEPMHHLRTTCRGCGGSDTERFLELGPQPLANAFLRDPARFSEEPRYPLDLYRCRSCHLVQLLDVIAAEALFRDYVYVTGTSETMTRHFADYARAVVAALGAGEEDLIVEVASNDGVLLAAAQATGVRVLGVEPARNIAELARERGVPTVAEFFDLELAKGLRDEHGPALAVIANNVLAHVDHTVDFLRGAAALLAEAGRVVTEFPYLRPMIEGLEYDTVYHEHLCYFSVLPLLRMFENAGLTIQRIDPMDVHGGSLRVWSALSSVHPEHAASVLEMAESERADGFADPARFEAFAEAVQAQRRELRTLLENLRAAGHTVAAYGAPAKGNTMLNFCGLDTELVRYIVDRNPLKAGSWAPGTHIPVSEVSRLETEPPDYLLILPWNLAGEIMKQQEAFAQRGGKFILPLPHPRVVES